LDALLEAATAPEADDLTATATSQLRDLPAFAPSAAVDGDPLTAWISQREGSAPAITLRWDGPVTVDSIGIQPAAGVQGVRRVVISSCGEEYERPLPAPASVSIPSSTTDEITISFPSDPTDRTEGRQVAISEISIPALLGRRAAVPDRDAEVA